MALEIERKFLLRNESWTRDVIGCERMRDGLIARFGDGKVRVRLTESKASLTIKGPRTGMSRAEFEIEISRADAEQLQTLCQEPTIEKTRYTVPFGGLSWTIDVYMGPLAGIVLAEVELAHPDQLVRLPPWVGEEVTDNPRFRKGALVEQFITAARVPEP